MVRHGEARAAWVALGLAGLLGCGDDGGGGPKPLGLAEHDCAVALPDGFGPDDVRCGTLTVLQDRDDPEGPRLDVAFAVALARETPAAPDPFVQVPGGPGQAVIEPFFGADPTGLLAEVNRARDLVFIDPRGTGLSTPDLACPERQARIDAALLAPGGAEEDGAARIAGMQACHDRLTRDRIDLSHFHSAAIAADFAAVLEALGYETYNVWGYSYGGRVAQVLMRDFPDRVRSAVLDAPTMPERYPAEPAMMQASLELLFARCAASDSCSGANPDLEETFYALVDDLDETPAEIPVTVAGEAGTAFISGDRFVAGIQLAMFGASLIEVVPQAITETAAGDLGLLTLTAPRLVGGNPTYSSGHEASVLCAEVAPFWPGSDYDASVADTDDALVEAIRPIAYDVDVGQCAFWDVDPRPDMARQPVMSDIPVLLLHGEYDLAVPPSNSALAAENLSNAQRVVFPGYGHVVLGQNADPDTASCERSILEAFLEAPTEPVDTSCVDALTDPF